MSRRRSALTLARCNLRKRFASSAQGRDFCLPGPKHKPELRRPLEFPMLVALRAHPRQPHVTLAQVPSPRWAPPSFPPPPVHPLTNHGRQSLYSSIDSQTPPSPYDH